METRDDEIGRLQRPINQLQRARFGHRPKRLDADQLALGIEDLDTDTARAEPHHAVPWVNDLEPDSRAASRRPTLRQTTSDGGFARELMRCTLALPGR